MRLYAVSDIHIGHPKNREWLSRVGRHVEDGLIVAGDVGETTEHLNHALGFLSERFAKVWWVPGNHEMWSLPKEGALRGEARYDQLVEIARKHGVLTPEDPYDVWPRADAPPLRIVPMWLLYDYSFRPDDVSYDNALNWAMEDNLLCTDEMLLHPDPHPTKAAWCHARVEATQRRLDELDPQERTLLINHFPLRRDTSATPRVPRFSIWCGTTKTEDWHTRYRADIVVTGHLHIRKTRHIDGVRFEEVSLGYPGQYDPEAPADDALRIILDTA